MIGIRSSNALIQMLYKKNLKISPATNKIYSSGEIINLVQVDCQKLWLIGENLASNVKLPVIIIVCFSILFYYLGWTFFCGIGVFFIAFIVNMVLGKKMSVYQR